MSGESMSFDELWQQYKRDDTRFNIDVAKSIYEAVAQSRQDEVDELKKRIDEIASHVDINFDEDRDDDQHSYWSGYNQAMRELNGILKGSKDEN